MNGRVNPFGRPDGTDKPGSVELPVFEPEPVSDTSVASTELDRLAEKLDFPSRQAQTRPARRRRKKRSQYTSPMYIRTTEDARKAFEEMAANKRVSHGALLEQAVAALKRLEKPDSNQSS